LRVNGSPPPDGLLNIRIYINSVVLLTTENSSERCDIFRCYALRHLPNFTKESLRFYKEILCRKLDRKKDGEQSILLKLGFGGFLSQCSNRLRSLSGMEGSLGAKRCAIGGLRAGGSNGIPMWWLITSESITFIQQNDISSSGVYYISG
jgi:hypothetical protein